MKTHYSRMQPAISALLSISAVYLFSFNVSAADAPDIRAMGPIPFASYDKDGNGVISEDEFNATRAERMQSKTNNGMGMGKGMGQGMGMANAPQFSDFDANSDGEVSADELLTGQAIQRSQRMNNGPKNGPNNKSMMNRGRMMPSFGDIDADDNGSISRTEMTMFKKQRIESRVEDGYPMKNMNQAYSFDSIDTNHDDVIDNKEFRQHQSAM
ncbi:MAG: hypothetical protein P1U57_11210 [Oleibacter sp.]|nr:hypothetical protein [Thalassolituus sp.]